MRVVALINAKLRACDVTGDFPGKRMCSAGRPRFATLKAMQCVPNNNGIDAYRNKRYPGSMTAAFGAITEYMLETKASRAEERESARQEILRMSETMKAEDGLLNHVQASTLLGVSVKRVSELVRLRKLSRFDFMGRTYVSVKEVMTRYREEIAAGERVRESMPKRLVKVVKAGFQSDGLQVKRAWKETQDQRAKEKQRAKQKRQEILDVMMYGVDAPKKRVKK